MDILEKIKFNCEVHAEQTELFTPSHTKYSCVVKYNNVIFSFPYQCNPKYELPTKESCLAILLSEADTYNNSYDFEDFCCELGFEYEDKKGYLKAMNTYNLCKSIYNFFNDSFTIEELKELNILLEDYK